MLADAGSCGTSCDIPAYGEDCVACTTDDVPMADPMVGLLTTEFIDGVTGGVRFSCSELSTADSPLTAATLGGSIGEAQVVLACE